MTILTGAWNDIELPLKFTTCLVVSKNVARDILDTGLVITLFCRVTNDDGVVNYYGR